MLAAPQLRYYLSVDPSDSPESISILVESEGRLYLATLRHGDGEPQWAYAYPGHEIDDLAHRAMTGSPGIGEDLGQMSVGDMDRRVCAQCMRCTRIESSEAELSEDGECTVCAVGRAA